MADASSRGLRRKALRGLVGFLGLLAHWVLNHSQKLQPEHIYAPDPSLSLRQEAREILKGSPGMLPLLQAERKQNVDAGEPEEQLKADR